jgi:hypothetical protein
MITSWQSQACWTQTRRTIPIKNVYRPHLCPIMCKLTSLAGLDASQPVPPPVPVPPVPVPLDANQPVPPQQPQPVDMIGIMQASCGPGPWNVKLLITAAVQEDLMQECQIRPDECPTREQEERQGKSHSIERPKTSHDLSAKFLRFAPVNQCRKGGLLNSYHLWEM